ncbi:MAG: 4Fe-4S binding protein [Spirochaetia bacterium]|nr:4Fe-4S binding protein [Spirochaetia bacterium]
MIRKIITIDEEKCSGCGLCAAACHEGAIEMVDGKARLTREDYCDGLGDCLPACPTGAIRFETREAPAYNEAAVAAAKAAAGQPVRQPSPCGCPGSQSRLLHRGGGCHGEGHGGCCSQKEPPSRLSQWPVQIKLMPVNAPYLNGADLLIAADCAPFAFADFHETFIKGRITLIGCPKLDGVDYSEKLEAMFAANDIRSITVVRMEVPCCGGLTAAVQRAVERSGRTVPVEAVTVSTEGTIL